MASKVVLSATILAILLAGCAGSPPVPAANFASATPNPIRISRTRLIDEVRYAGASDQPAPGQIDGLMRFIAANAVAPKDTLLIERTEDPLDATRAERLSENLSGIGLRPATIVSRDITSGVVQVVVERYVAIAPNCPDWTTAPGANFTNRNQRNFGCADATNLAAMVADPKDLAMGATLAPQVGDAVTRPVDAYRKGMIRFAPQGSSRSSAGATSGSGAPGAGAGAGGGPTSPTGP